MPKIRDIILRILGSREAAGCNKRRIVRCGGPWVRFVPSNGRLPADKDDDNDEYLGDRTCSLG